VNRPSHPFASLDDVAEHIARHFVSAEIRHFPASEAEAALD